MMRKRKGWIVLAFCLLLCMFVTACGGRGNGGTNENSGTNGNGISDGVNGSDNGGSGFEITVTNGSGREEGGATEPGGSDDGTGGGNVNFWEVGLQDPDMGSMRLRIVKQDGDMFLCADITNEDSLGVYRFSTGDAPIYAEDGYDRWTEDLKVGCVIEILFNGGIQESYPGTPCGIACVRVIESAFDNLCELYMNVMDDLWEEDEALNYDTRMIGVDLSQTRLTPSEQDALAWGFAEKHDKETVQGTFAELVNEGFIDGENLYWEDGILFSITEKETEGVYSLPVLTFDAEKWRSGLGAFGYFNATSTQSERGEWGGYQVESVFIS